MKRYRLLALAALGAAVVLLGVLFVGNINGNLVYFLTPEEALVQKSDFVDGRRLQIGGLVQEGSVESSPDGLRFTVVSDSGLEDAAVPVVYDGSPAQLFRPGIGVVMEGTWADGTFDADTMIVKHDENYAPPEAEAQSEESELEGVP
ncbi:UNVERIFIED_ORG: cytochrome c maturation protein CcmE [Bacillus sp. AZ43]